ncbi:MAG: ribose-phosphate pyrophosphokinase [Nitrospirae bacterium]|nr:ribose-phosphate pyrophosphokinase [Nitrospirota bacterium]
MGIEKITLFALKSSRAFGEKVSAHLGIPLSEHEEREFEDGEHKSRPLVNVRGQDVFVIQSLHSDQSQSVNDKLCRLLFFIGAIRDSSAGKVTAVVPYLGYSRKDQKSQSRDPVTTRYISTLLEAVGTDHVVTLDVHNLAAYQNAFRCQSDHLEARKLFVQYFAPLVKDAEVVVMSPDVGGIKRAEQFRKVLSEVLDKTVSIAYLEKFRSKGIVSGEALVGEIGSRVIIIIDDLISTGGTLARAAKASHELEASKIYAAASHGIFVGDASHVLADSYLEKVVITNTILPSRFEPAFLKHKVVVLDAAALFAEAIKRIHSGGSLVELLEA